MTSRKKQPDEQLENNRYVITAEIVRKGRDGDFYVRRSVADYRIDLQQSEVSSAELQKHIATELFQIKMTTMEIAYLDVSSGLNNKEVIIYSIRD